MKRLSVLFAMIPVLLVIFAFTYGIPEDNTKGKEIFTANKCGTCHAVESEGLTSKGKGPDLSKLGDTIKTGWIEKFLKKQEKKNGKAHPPAFKGNDNDLKALSTWIVSLNSSKKAGKKDSGKKDQSSNDMMKSMDKMNKEMAGTKVSGNADRDFAHLMIHHHQGAIDMSKSELANGTDQKVKDLAQKIIDTQSADIEKLKQYDDLKKISDADAKSSDDMASHHNDMDASDSAKSGSKDLSGNTDMQRSSDVTGSTTEASSHMDMVESMKEKINGVDMTGNTDKDFVAMMIVHHQTAIDMTESYLDKIQDTKLKEMANNIISSSKKEIEELEKLK